MDVGKICFITNQWLPQQNLKNQEAVAVPAGSPPGSDPLGPVCPPQRALPEGCLFSHCRTSMVGAVFTSLIFFDGWCLLLKSSDFSISHGILAMVVKVDIPPIVPIIWKNCEVVYEWQEVIVAQVFLRLTISMTSWSSCLRVSGETTGFNKTKWTKQVNRDM